MSMRIRRRTAPQMPMATRRASACVVRSRARSSKARGTGSHDSATRAVPGQREWKLMVLLWYGLIRVLRALAPSLTRPGWVGGRLWRVEDEKPLRGRR